MSGRKESDRPFKNTNNFYTYTGNGNSKRLITVDSVRRAIETLKDSTNREERLRASSALSFYQRYGANKETKNIRVAPPMKAKQIEKLAARKIRNIELKSLRGNDEDQLLNIVTELGHQAEQPEKDNLNYMKPTLKAMKDTDFYISGGVLKGGPTPVVKYTNSNEIMLPLFVHKRAMTTSLASYVNPYAAIPKRKILYRVGAWAIPQEEKHRVDATRATRDMVESIL